MKTDESTGTVPPSPSLDITPSAGKTGSGLGPRLFSAVIGIPVFLILCLAGSGYFALGLIVLSALAVTELLRTYNAHGIRPNPVLAAAGALGPAIGLPSARFWLYSPEAYPLFVRFLAGLFLVAGLWEVARAARTGEMRAGQGMAYGALCGAYVALFAGLAWLRQAAPDLHGGLAGRTESGALIVLVLLFCVWATDSVAYFVGRKWGRQKLAPRISPGKTVEGAIGGIAAALIVGAVCGRLLLGAPFFGVLIGALAGVFGQLGDLFKSVLKREVGVKDFGAILPGHGGIIDRFDSLLFVAPILSILMQWFPPSW